MKNSFTDFFFAFSLAILLNKVAIIVFFNSQVKLASNVAFSLILTATYQQKSAVARKIQPQYCNFKNIQ